MHAAPIVALGVQALLATGHVLLLLDENEIVAPDLTPLRRSKLTERNGRGTPRVYFVPVVTSAAASTRSTASS